MKVLVISWQFLDWHMKNCNLAIVKSDKYTTAKQKLEQGDRIREIFCVHLFMRNLFCVKEMVPQLYH